MKTKSILNAVDIDKVIKHFKGGHRRRYTDKLIQDLNKQKDTPLTETQVNNVKKFVMSLNYPQQFNMTMNLMHMTSFSNDDLVYEKFLMDEELCDNVKQKRDLFVFKAKRRLETVENRCNCSGNFYIKLSEERIDKELKND